LAVSNLQYLGRHTGRMIALSTVGSLAGTWGTAFFFLSWIGSHALVAWLGAVQSALGLWWLFKGARVRPSAVVLWALVIGALGTGAWFPIQMLKPPVYQEDSPYQQVRIRDDDLFRYLVLDRTFHAVMWKAEPDTLFLPYSQLMVSSLALVTNPKRALILGHGGGSFTKWLARYWPELEVDVVEFDPVVVRMAEQYFSYHAPPRHHVYVRDARAFLRQTQASYDLIWVDAFARHLVPFHLTTEEFFVELGRHLSANGVVVVNLASSGTPSDLRRAYAVVETMKRSFPRIETYAVKGPWPSSSKAENLLFFAGGPMERQETTGLGDKVAELVVRQRLPAEAIALLATRRMEPWPPGIVLTDDYAPYDLLVGAETGEEHPQAAP
jgi:spermidine synthase